jgi:hypothetical protein
VRADPLVMFAQAQIPEVILGAMEFADVMEQVDPEASEAGILVCGVHRF